MAHGESPNFRSKEDSSLSPANLITGHKSHATPKGREKEKRLSTTVADRAILIVAPITD
jgi:hypothetical protein